MGEERKSWRPEGWLGIVKHEKTLEENNWDDTFEAGADAMLVALRRKAWRRKENGIILPSKKSLIDAKSGYLVFIPDEGE